MNDITINIVADSRHGVFCDRVRICSIGEEVPEEFADKQVKVFFPSGLMLDCLGKNAKEYGEGRK